MDEVIFSRTFYFCNGENPACSRCEGCYKSGGECKQTTNIKYILTPECKDPWNHPERFERVSYPECNTYYFEKEPEDNEPESENNDVFE